MHTLSISEAVKIIPVSESTLRRDLKIGKVSSTTDKDGKRVVDVAELQRVYGTLQSNDTPKTVNETDKIVALLEERITELKTQWEKSEARETTLLELLPAKEKNLAIATSERKRGIFSFLKR